MKKNLHGLKALFHCCQKIEDEKLLSEFLDLFLSGKEKEALNDRFLIIQALVNQKDSQREIAKKLGVSIAKITRGSNELKRINKHLLAYLKKSG